MDMLLFSSEKKLIFGYCPPGAVHHNDHSDNGHDSSEIQIGLKSKEMRAAKEQSTRWQRDVQKRGKHRKCLVCKKIFMLVAQCAPVCALSLSFNQVISSQT